MGALSKGLKYAAAGKALKHAKNIKKPTKKTIFIILGIVAGIILLLVAGFIALIIWLVGLVNSNAISETTSNATQSIQEATNSINLNDYIQNGQADVQAIEQQIRSLSPEQLVVASDSLRTQINRLLEESQIIQSQADQLLNLLP